MMNTGSPGGRRSPDSVNVAVLVATRNRPELLESLAQRIDAQTLKPSIVVIVDSSDGVTSGRWVSDAGVPTERIGTTIASLTAQKNLGLDFLFRPGSTFDAVAVLDDDVEPGPDYLHLLTAGLLCDDAVVGVSATIDTPAPVTSDNFLRRVQRVFLLTSDEPGRLLPSGINVGVHRGQLSSISEPEWLMGVSVWRASVAMQLRYMPQAPGSSLGEDVEFSVRAARFGALRQYPDVILGHSLAQHGRADPWLQQFRWIRNRSEIIRAMGGGPRHWTAYWWSNLGQAIILSNGAIRLIKRKNRQTHAHYLDSLRGLASGSWAVVRRQPMR